MFSLFFFFFGNRYYKRKSIKKINKSTFNFKEIKINNNKSKNLTSFEPIRNTLNADSPPHSVDKSVASLHVYVHSDGFK